MSVVRTADGRVRLSRIDGYGYQVHRVIVSGGSTTREVIGSVLPFAGGPWRFEPELHGLFHGDLVVICSALSDLNSGVPCDGRWWFER